MGLGLDRPSPAFWALTLSIAFGLTLPILIQDAMFQDAVLYSAVAHNLSVDHGTFWFLQYSTLNLEGIPSFHEQPPLFFGILSVFYKIFGSSIYVERVYSFFILILNIYLIHLLWKTIFKTKPHLQSFSWLPVVFWITIPVCFWSFRSLMIENTMSVFILVAIILALMAIQEGGVTWKWMLSGIFIFLASFCKGFPGFFPLVIPFLYWVVYRHSTFLNIVKVSILLMSVPVLMYGILLMFPESRQSLSIYFFDRLLARIDDMPTTFSRLETLRRLFFELIPALIIVFITWVFNRQTFFIRIKEFNREIILLLLIGLSGTLPLMLTMIQKGWYMVPAFPYFGVVVALVILPFVHDALQSMKPKMVRTTTLVSFLILASVFGLTLAQKGEISREKETLSDVYTLGKVIPPFSTVTVPLDMYDEYNFVLQGFLVRHFFISISPHHQYEYFLTLPSKNYPIPANYTPVNLSLKKYTLYKKTPQ